MEGLRFLTVFLSLFLGSLFLDCLRRFLLGFFFDVGAFTHRYLLMGGLRLDVRRCVRSAQIERPLVMTVQLALDRLSFQFPASCGWPTIPGAVPRSRQGSADSGFLRYG